VVAVLDIDITYLAFPVLSALFFWRLSARTALLVTYFGGWLVLPVGHYPDPQVSAGIPWWITGLALPADMLVSKAWIVPAVALLGAATSDFPTVRRARPSWIDIPMVLWCLWPLIDSYLTAEARPSGPVATFYVTGGWGLSWVLGRIWFAETESRVLLLKAAAWSGLACLPFALLEGAGIASVYDVLYGPHPFYLDGLQRYVGFRPIGLFEHGNQYGIWVSLAALAAVWLALAVSVGWRRRIGFVLVALVTTAIAFAAQSVGAIVLLLAGLCILVVWRLRATVPLLIAALCGIAVLLALQLSGIVPCAWPRLVPVAVLAAGAIAGGGPARTARAEAW